MPTPGWPSVANFLRAESTSPSSPSPMIVDSASIVPTPDARTEAHRRISATPGPRRKQEENSQRA